MSRALIALALTLGASACSIDSRSGEFACDPGCPSDRVCVDGYCVQADARTDARQCPSVCDDCTANVCEIRCNASGSCASTVACPDGWDCDVECTGIDSCAGGVECDPGDACTIACIGPGSCAGQVQCDTGACDVTCSGPGSCAAGTDCQASCRCDTNCAGSACAGGNDCPGPAQCDQGGECTSQAGVCRSC